MPKLQKDPNIEKIIGIDISDYAGDPEKVQFFKVDVRDEGEVARALNGADVLIHLAFIVIPNRLPRIKVIYDINVNGSIAVFQAAAKSSVKKIIHLSSQSVYGHLRECVPVASEDTPRLGIKTTNFYYSHTKALVEQFLDEFEKLQPSIAVIRLRPPIITGPHFTQNSGLFTVADKKRIITIRSETAGKATPLQFIHEDDLTDIISAAVSGSLHGAYNVSSNVLPDFSAFISREYGVKLIPIPRFLVRFAIKLGRFWPKLLWLQAILYNSLLDTSKIERELGWKPKYTTEECLRGINMKPVPETTGSRSQG